MKCPFEGCVKGEMTAYGLAIHLRQRHKHEVIFPVYIRFWSNGQVDVVDANMKLIAQSRS